MYRSFDPGGHYAALDSAQWLTIKAALEGDEAQRDAALDALGGLVTDEWLDSEPEPDMVGRHPEQIGAMRAARQAYEDRWVRERCALGIGILQRQRDQDRPYAPQQLDSAGRNLLMIATEFLHLARSRDDDREVEANS
ncbi:hypothetical protein [Qaidamihabitans albus]|uniref:hypothetical protein n=1 Tax=Qaidamihabitans albus TaxID=2795733 RepID=UPI001B3572CE|nr:hypothetical protein [Qaidamihabitans albus]